MNKEVYLKELRFLKNQMEHVKNTPFSMFAKAATLVTLNMRYEKIAFGQRVKTHPFLLTKEIIKDAQVQFKAFQDISFIEGKNKDINDFKSRKKEEKHRNLFNEIWDRYGWKDYKRYVERYIHRIKINNLPVLIKDKRCIDMGCGNGNFCFALLKSGAGFAAGVDFGEKSINYAKNVAHKLNLARKTIFKCESVYQTSFKDDTFDFAIQNGVFHHLDNEEKAIRETRRILKKGGWFWYYTDGEGGISYDLWDTSVEILKDVPVLFIEQVLGLMNVNRDKTAHLMDGLSATYRHTSWDKITKKLASLGFGNFRRLTGGYPTDFDLNRINKGPYGRVKFGEGDLRILCQLVRK